MIHFFVNYDYIYMKLGKNIILKISRFFFIKDTTEKKNIIFIFIYNRYKN